MGILAAKFVASSALMLQCHKIVVHILHVRALGQYCKSLSTVSLPTAQFRAAAYCVFRLSLARRIKTALLVLQLTDARAARSNHVPA
jgi:hypothetical protein